ncbi:MAG: hypothetical protein RIQ79_117 [Verrucomicrobiota bacterium]
MSDLPDHSPPAAETPAEHIAAVQKKKNLYQRVTSSMPLLITVILHVVLGLVAAAVVVQQNVGGKKKTFEAAAQNDGAVKQVEHRLQVARRASASGAAQSPVSANRIFSTAENALQMPAMPDLPSMGTGGFGGFGGMGTGVGMGAGSGMATSMGGGTGLGGRGFMSLSFLGSTTQNASKIVFVLDVEPGLMDVRKGGYSAFKIIREQIMQLVGNLPPSAEFNVVVYEYEGSRVNVGLFAPALLPALSQNKKRVNEWLSAVNGSPSGPYGIRTASNITPPNFSVPDSVKLDPDYNPAYWLKGLHAALAQKPDCIYLVTGSSDLGRVDRKEEGLYARKRKQFEDAVAKQRADIIKMGLDPDVVAAARRAAYDKVHREFDALNQRLIAEKKDPFVVKDINRIFEPDFQASMRKRGLSPLKLDLTGWTDKKGDSIPEIVWRGAGGWSRAAPTDATAFISRLQSAYLTTSATINLFLFAGPQDDPAPPTEVLSPIARRNRGSFQVITAKRLEEIKAREAAAK